MTGAAGGPLPLRLGRGRALHGRHSLSGRDRALTGTWVQSIDVFFILLWNTFGRGSVAGRFTMCKHLTPNKPKTKNNKVRGLVVSIQQLSITAGILLAGALNVGLQVRATGVCMWLVCVYVCVNYICVGG